MPVFLTIIQGSGMDNVKCAVGIRQINHVHEAAADPAADDSASILLATLWIRRPRRSNHQFAFLRCYTVLARMMQVPVVPTEFHD